MGVSLYPAISQPLWGQLYGWLPLSNAYGISSIENIARSFCQPMKTNITLFAQHWGIFRIFVLVFRKGMQESVVR